MSALADELVVLEADELLERAFGMFDERREFAPGRGHLPVVRRGNFTGAQRRHGDYWGAGLPRNRAAADEQNHLSLSAKEAGGTGTNQTVSISISVATFAVIAASISA
jgi:hypothetical protein